MKTFSSILNNSFDAISAVAASVGIDWSAHANEACEDYETKKAATLDAKGKGKCAIKVYTEFTRQGVKYPVINFRSFKGGTQNATWSGFNCAIGGNSSAIDYEAIAAQKEASKAARCAKDAAEQEQRVQDRARSLARFDAAPWLDELTIESKYLNKKRLSQFDYYFKKLQGNNLAYPLFDLSTFTHELDALEQVGYAKINDDTGQKGRSTGSGGCIAVAIHQSQNGNEKTAYICEGIADALTCSLVKEGTFFSVVGTAQIKSAAAWLAKSGLFEQIVILADNDEAGRKASIFDADFCYSVVSPKRQKDYSDVYVNEGKAALIEQLSNVIHTQSSVTQNQRYCDFTIQDNAINLLVAEKGTGKTTAIKRHVKTAKGSMLVICHRRSLGRQIAAELGAGYYEDVIEGQGKQGLNTQSRLVISCEQIKFIDASEAYDTVIIDECEQVFAHAAQSKTISDHRITCKQIYAICNNAKTLILSDADASTCTKYLINASTKVDKKPVVKLINNYKVRQERGDTLRIFDKQKQAHGTFERHLMDRVPTLFITDTKEDTKKAAAIAAKHKAKALVLNSETIDQYAKQLQHIDSFVSQFDAVIYSPTLGTGFSVAEGHKFKKAVFLFQGKSITAESCSQMLARFRGVGNYAGYIGNAFSTLPTTYDAVKRALIDAPADKTQAELKAQVFDVDAKGNRIIDVYSGLFIAAEAGRNKSKNNFKQRCIDVFASEGFDVSDSTIEDVAQADTVFTVEALSERKAEREAEKEKEARTLATALNDALPHNHTIDMDTLEEVARNNSRVVKGLKAQAYANLDTKAAHRLDAKQLLDVNSKLESQVRFKHAALRRKTLLKIYKALGICPITLDIKHSETISNGRGALSDFAKAHYDDVYALFNVALNRSNSLKAFEQLASIIGVRISTKKVGENERIAWINADSLDVLKTAKSIYSSRIGEVLGMDLCAALDAALLRTNDASKTQIEREKMGQESRQNAAVVFSYNYENLVDRFSSSISSTGAASSHILKPEKGQKCGMVDAVLLGQNDRSTGHELRHKILQQECEK